MTGTTINLSRKRFSLIELLVVVAIMGILMALLLPALSKAKKTATRIECAGNLKQFGAACHMYANDYYDYMPITRPEDCAYWISCVYPYITSDKRTWDGSWSLPRLFRCQENLDAVYEPSANVETTNYGYNRHIGISGFESDVFYAPRRLSRAKYPAEFFAMSEKNTVSTTRPYLFLDRYDNVAQYAAQPHNLLTNILYVDAHVNALRLNASVFYRRLGYFNLNCSEWSP